MTKNTLTLVAALTVASFAFGGLAAAQDRDGRGGRDGRDGRPGFDNRQGQMERGDDRGRREDYRRGGRDDDRRGYQARGGERGAGPDHDFYRGGRLPMQYRNRGYVVDDWRGHRLSAPPRGYHWVQTGGDYVLVAIATGIIAQILLNQ